MAANLTERAGTALTRAHGFLQRLPPGAISAQGRLAVITQRAGLTLCEIARPELRTANSVGVLPSPMPFAGPDEPLQRLVTGRRQPLPDSVPPSTPDDAPPWALGLLRADPQTLTDLAEQAALDSLWGATTTAMPSRVRAGWSTALPVAIALAVQARDLAVLPTLIRAAGYLALHEHPLTTGAAAFLISQQQPDGGLGALPTSADPQLAIHARLPLTVSFAWTLAELLDPGFTTRIMSGEVTHGT
ncbi:hypothetical protein [Actinoplanes sp. NPDC051859]|uniref:hypothetical protein n=1 Tax=Actinoplanes sp. NPDC051859 TaxID=3363909 RepID=UPI0037A76B38